MQQNHKIKSNGFTLIELSIVLVIIGLIVGGVLVGQDLIRAAQIRSVVKDIEQYKTAVYTFRTKYDCLAGDCPNATTYFGAENATPATCQTTASTGTLTCDGNGDGQVADTTYEMFRFWQQLAIAGLIKGKYTGVSGASGSAHHILGTNAPSSAINGAVFGFSYFNYPNGDSNTYAMNYENTFWFGAVTVSRPQNPVFSPAEAQVIDKKIDDGKPATGFVISLSNYNPWLNSKACSTSTNQTDYSGIYNVSVKDITCSLMIKSGI